MYELYQQDLVTLLSSSEFKGKIEGLKNLHLQELKSISLKNLNILDWFRPLLLQFRRQNENF